MKEIIITDILHIILNYIFQNTLLKRNQEEKDAAATPKDECADSAVDRDGSS